MVEERPGAERETMFRSDGLAVFRVSFIRHPIPWYPEVQGYTPGLSQSMGSNPTGVAPTRSGSAGLSFDHGANVRAGGRR